MAAAPVQPKELTEPCKHCGTTAWERLQRLTFTERRILSLIGRYPWRCAICNNKRYLPLRYDPLRARESLRRRAAS